MRCVPALAVASESSLKPSATSDPTSDNIARNVGAFSATFVNYKVLFCCDRDIFHMFPPSQDIQYLSVLELEAGSRPRRAHPPKSHGLSG